MRAVVDATVRDMTRARTSILTEVSGGLDSAIMATALKASGFGGEVIWLNTSGPFAESDERRYARAVVEAMDESLTEVLRTSEDMAAGLAFDHPRTLRPSLNRMDATYDALQAELCDRHDVDAVLTGKGGDVAFFQTATSAILSDQIRDQGPGALFSRTAPVLARRLRRSAWRVLKAGWAGSTSAERPAPPSNLLLSGEVENAPAPCTLGWPILRVWARANGSRFSGSPAISGFIAPRNERGALTCFTRPSVSRSWRPFSPRRPIS
ncbi:asparagine synthase-related protein [Brevundimonas albigilva]|uniref:asparagine synthase-related protein n=1 Tax=Brevundimonas albigilva TaxID=1312364 RepID=UPI00201B6518|nr:asparagine synthase-related protein [Brevundimonas albigilva]UQV17596.1 asparagine synthase-related protein [Brevundimonas albigilva]